MKSINNKMSRLKICSFFFTLLLTLSANTFSQTVGRNNPYSPSPNSKPKPTNATENKPAGNSGNTDISLFVIQRSVSQIPDDRRPMIDIRPSIAQATLKIAKVPATKTLPPTETYKIGVGDVLFVDLKNSPQGSGYFTVRNDGTIDYPLAGDNVVVAEKTIDTAEETIVGGITLFSAPQVEVKVRQYGSHKINVSGMVEASGEKNLQREAMPLFAIKAEAIVNPKATRVIIIREPQSKAEIYDLRDSKTDDVLIFPGNSVEFSGDQGISTAYGSFFISGEIVSSGQKDLTSGLTLFQAVVISGGAKGDPKKAVVRRKNEKGLFTVIEHNLRSIKDGRAMDPFLAAGDVIEIKN